MDTAAISVVIPAYNSAATVGETLESILAQTVVPRQIIVIDDGSKDATAQRVKDFGGRVTYRLQENGGPSKARNHGIRLANEPLVAFIDADDVWHPRKVELQLRCMGRHAELGMLATESFAWPAARFPETSEEAAVRMTPVTWDQLVVRTLILTSTVMVKREVLERVGEFDASLCGPEDRDMFLRITEAAPVGMMGLALTGYRDTAGSLTKAAATCEAGMRKILQRIDEGKGWKGKRWLRRKSYSFMHYRCAAAQARAGNNIGAVVRGIKSLAYYPLPYERDEVRMRLDRPKRLAVNVLRLMHLKGPDRAPDAAPLPAKSAFEHWRENMGRGASAPSGVATN